MATLEPKADKEESCSAFLFDVVDVLDVLVITDVLGFNVVEAVVDFVVTVVDFVVVLGALLYGSGSLRYMVTAEAGNFAVQNDCAASKLARGFRKACWSHESPETRSGLFKMASKWSVLIRCIVVVGHEWL